VAKKLKAIVRLQLNAGKANPAPRLAPRWPVTHQYHGFLQGIHARTSHRAGEVIPAEITIYTDGSFAFILKSSPAAVLLKKAAGVEKGSATPNRAKVGKVTKARCVKLLRLN